MNSIRKPAFIPNDSDYVYEVAANHVTKTHKKLFSYEGKKAVMTNLTAIELEKRLQHLSKIMSTGLYNIIYGC